MKSFNANSFKSDLMNLPWSNTNNLEDVNDRWELWKNMFLSIVDKHAPFKRKRVRNIRSPWMTPHLKKLLVNQDKLKKAAEIIVII